MVDGGPEAGADSCETRTSRAGADDEQAYFGGAPSRALRERFGTPEGVKKGHESALHLRPRHSLITSCGGGSNATGSSSSGAAGDASGGTSNPGDGETGASAGAAESGPTGKIDLCSVFSAAALSSASGKSFGETLETESDGVYGCAYESSSDTFD